MELLLTAKMSIILMIGSSYLPYKVDVHSKVHKVTFIKGRIIPRSTVFFATATEGP